MITSVHNKRVVKAARLKKRAMREKERRFLIEGPQAVAEAVGSGAGVHEVFVTPEAEERAEGVIAAARAAGIRVHVGSAEVMAHLTSTVTPQGVVAVASFVDVPLVQAAAHDEVLAVLVEVRDPGNAGTILRSADAAAAGGVVFTRSSVDVYNPKAVRATAGSLFHVPVVREVDVEEGVAGLRGAGFQILAADAAGETSIYEVSMAGRTAVLFGNEAHGLGGSARGLADRTVRVPIAGRAESLNLAAAATLVLFEAARQRLRRDGGDDLLAGIVAGAAHDVRSPLTALKGFAATLRSRWDRLSEEQRLLMLEGIAHDAVRMDVVVSHLVEAARLVTGTVELSPDRLDLRSLAAGVAAEVRAWATADIEVDGAPVEAFVDPTRTRLILLAMVEAAAWWGEQGPVTVETVADPPGFLVWRAGSTVEADRAENLFLPRTPGTGGGSKVGLFVARGLAELQGGSLGVEVGERLSFRVALRR